MTLIERLREHLNYDEKTGLFTWKKPTNKRIKVGQVAGSPNSDGYILIKFDKKNIKSHRIAWAFVYGEFPDKEIDHINRNPSDNRIENLRLATRSENLLNKRSSKQNKLGVKGVTRHGNKYQAHIRLNGEFKYLGYFSSIEDAKAAYQNAAERNKSEFRIDE